MPHKVNTNPKSPPKGGGFHPQTLMTRFKNPWLWLHSLVAAFIGGGASAITTQMGLLMAQAVGMPVRPLNWSELGIVALSAGIYNAAMYLKRSPLPPLETGDTAQFTRKLDSGASRGNVGPLVAILVPLLLLTGCAVRTNDRFDPATGRAVQRQTICTFLLMGRAASIDSQTRDGDYSYRLRVGGLEGKGDSDMVKAIYEAGIAAGKKSIVP